MFIRIFPNRKLCATKYHPLSKWDFRFTLASPSQSEYEKWADKGSHECRVDFDFEKTVDFQLPRFHYAISENFQLFDDSFHVFWSRLMLDLAWVINIYYSNQKTDSVNINLESLDSWLSLNEVVKILVHFILDAWHSQTRTYIYGAP